MLPIAMSVIKLLVDDSDGFTQKDKNFSISVMLGIAFSANAGGIATVIGTPPNSILIGLLENEYQIEISFLKWMAFGLPFSIIMIALSYITLVHLIFPSKGLNFTASKEVIKNELEKLGPTAPKEKMVLVIFGVTVSLWIFRTLINAALPNLGLTDTMISIFAAIALFSIPFNLKKGDFILQWKDTEKLAWGILILFGGGLALANGMSVTGIVDRVSQAIAAGNFSVSMTAGLLIVLMLFMTELMSNVALVAVLAPVVAGIAIGLGLPIVYLLIPVTMASSCAFMLPMATPPNAIVFASGFIEVKDMVKAGIILNLVAVLLLILLFEFIIPLLF
jgi:sodium-dependent dicarboxylate transporter 2/3/5